MGTNKYTDFISTRKSLSSTIKPLKRMHSERKGVLFINDFKLWVNKRKINNASNCLLLKKT